MNPWISQKIVRRALKFSALLLCLTQLLGAPLVSVAQVSPRNALKVNDLVDGAKLTIIKDAAPDSPQDFEYYGPFGLNFYLDDAVPDDGDAVHDSLSLIVPPGEYNFSEVGLPEWNLSTISCTPADKVVIDMSINSAKFVVEAGDDVTCTYLNTLLPEITLTATPVESTSTPIPTAPATSTDTPTNTPTNTPVPPTETATETATNTPVPPTETATDTPVPPTDTPTETPALPTETPTSTPTDTSLPPTDTPTNTPIASTATPASGKATIIIKKDAQPNSIQDFHFYSAFGEFWLDDALPDDGDSYSNMISYVVNPGTYNFSEVVPTSWYLSAINCSGGNTTVNMPQRSVMVMPQPGDTIVCTFVNQRRVNIQAKKYNDLNGDGLHENSEPFMSGWEIERYDVAGTLLAHKVTDSTGQADFLLLTPGTYKICETPQPGWTNTTLGIPDELVNKPCYNLLMPPGMGVNVLFGNQQTSSRVNIGKESINVQYYWLEDINDPNTMDPEVYLAQKWLYLPVMSR